MHISDDPAPGDCAGDYIARILGSESTTYRLDQAILFTACDALGTMSSRKQFRGRDKSIIGWPLISTEQPCSTRAMLCNTPLARTPNVAPTTI
jgi:hypothetical protein